ncbi:MAG TPA: hypothetical protein EYN79_10755 [Planctomycetes bacterium]|nr:hypothetical protein [Planctomycetota bacterium]HIN80863.1 hypothetical protein [Planctomycetota bacterium]
MQGESWPYCSCSLLLSLLLIAPVFAQEPPIPPGEPPPSDEPAAPRDFFWVFDGIRGDLSQRVLDLSERVDNFFGDETLDDEPSGTRVRVRSTLRFDEGGEIEESFKVRARVSLPRTRERLGLFIESFREELDFNLDDLSPTSDGSSEDEDVAGLRAALLANERGSLSLDGSVKIDSGVQPRARLRWREDHSLDVWNLRLIQSLEWRNEEGWGETTFLRFQRVLEEDRLLRWGSRFHYSETSDGLEVFTEALFFHPIDEITGIFFSIDARGRSKPRRVVDEYGAQIRLRRLVRSDWLYLEVAPRVAFPEENDRAAEFIFFFTLESILGHTGDRRIGLSPVTFKK